jgi:ferric-dicitrate binding protein FerR (iron transport regulator)
MNAERPDLLKPEETRAREALRGLAPPRADAAFRERLKRDFVTGRIGERRSLVVPVAWHRRWVWRLALAPVALALLAASVWMADRGPGWTVMATQGDGAVTVNGVAVPLASREDLEQKIRPGARLLVPAGAEVELASTSGLVVQVTAGTEFTLPATPGRWFRRQVRGAVRHGEIRVTTGPGFVGARLRLDTPEAEVEVTGTTLAVICEPAGTCVCVYDGVVRMGPRGGNMEPVSKGRRRFVFNDGRAPESAEIRPMEIGKLGMFRDSRRGFLEGADR